MSDKFMEGLSDIEGDFFGAEKSEETEQGTVVISQGGQPVTLDDLYTERDRLLAMRDGGLATMVKLAAIENLNKLFAEATNQVPQPAPRKRVLETDSATRKQYPMAAGLLDYFPDALAEVSRVSFLGNEKHNPGQPLHHARGKSMDHADCIVRHLVGRGGFDGGVRESAALAWRALALLQEELEREHNLPLPRGAKGPTAMEHEASFHMGEVK